MLEPRRLLTFREVARQGSFSRAAAVLSLSQPAVSQQITALEAELGTRLLDRGRGGTVTTQAGALLLEHAEALAERLELASAQLASRVAEERRELRVGAFPSAIPGLVVPALAAVRAEAPDVQLGVEEASLQALARKVASGHLHAAVCFQPTGAERREPDGTRRVDLWEEPFVALVGASHPLAGRDEIALAELAGDEWMAPSSDGILVEACRAAGFEPRLSILTRDPLAIRALAVAELAVTLTPRLVAELELPRMVTVPVRDAPTRALYALLPAVGAHALALRFVEALRHESA